MFSVPIKILVLNVRWDSFFWISVLSVLYHCPIVFIAITRLVVQNVNLIIFWKMGSANWIVKWNHVYLVHLIPRLANHVLKVFMSKIRFVQIVARL